MISSRSFSSRTSAVRAAIVRVTVSTFVFVTFVFSRAECILSFAPRTWVEIRASCETMSST